MTVQEAIERLVKKLCHEKEPHKFCRDACMYGEEHCEVQMAKMCMEKQIPKKPRTDDEDWLCCRNCGETFSLVNTLHKRNKYCGNCGTKIDWSEVGGTSD